MQRHAKVLLGVAAVGVLVFVASVMNERYGVAAFAMVALFAATSFYVLGRANLPREDDHQGS